jgi:hypothetical protein
MTGIKILSLLIGDLDDSNNTDWTVLFENDNQWEEMVGKGHVPQIGDAIDERVSATGATRYTFESMDTVLGPETSRGANKRTTESVIEVLKEEGWTCFYGTWWASYKQGSNSWRSGWQCKRMAPMVSVVSSDGEVMEHHHQVTLWDGEDYMAIEFVSDLYPQMKREWNGRRRVQEELPEGSGCCHACHDQGIQKGHSLCTPCPDGYEPGHLGPNGWTAVMSS